LKYLGVVFIIDVELILIDSVLYVTVFIVSKVATELAKLHLLQ